jgi:hypothetical protein
VSFINTFFLFAIGTMALPVLFHFVRKMRAKKLPFGSLMFLTATPKELIKKRRLRDLLLMALRASILGLLALAFARPFIPPELIPFVSREDSESVVILLDNSYSMQAEGVFERAKQAVVDRIEAADEDDEIAIVQFADVPQQLTTFDGDREIQRNVVSSVVSISSRGTDFYEPLRLAEELLTEAGHAQQKVVLVSDFQQPGWTGPLENWKLAPGVLFEPVKVAADDPENAYVDELVVDVRRSGSQVSVRFDARVKAQGRALEETLQQNRTTLNINGIAVDRRTIPASETSQVSFQQIARREGVFQGDLALNDDDLEIDNRYYFTYSVEGKPSVLSIDGGTRGTLTSSSCQTCLRCRHRNCRHCDHMLKAAAMSSSPSATVPTSPRFRPR